MLVAYNFAENMMPNWLLFSHIGVAQDFIFCLKRFFEHGFELGCLVIKLRNWLHFGAA